MDSQLSTTGKVEAKPFEESKAQNFKVLKMVYFKNSYHVEWHEESWNEGAQDFKEKDIQFEDVIH